jgi:predicted GNAT superfamily acetyltransferase
VSEPTYRRVALADLDAVRELNDAAVPAVNSISMEQFGIFGDEAPFFEVAELDGRIVAFLVGLTHPGDVHYESMNYAWFKERFGSFLYVDRVVVDPSAHGRGIGRAFYDHFTAAHGADHEYLCAEVNLRPRNSQSLAFHERLGFVAYGEQTTDGGAKRVTMLAKRLESTTD